METNDLIPVNPAPGLITDWGREVGNCWNTVSPGNDHDRFSLACGWAIGKGLDPEDANEFAAWAVYFWS